ncbi:hypothetical protein MTBBW1_850029 [Desulfamplus magnetovallimortis]|uniref:Uncharacterized protein n=1 Tax=Desulfamplus magnetovallimortis TaxID=1246637 RepID=A0A1W1HKL8_9BACT|nr:hypothetical protein MTBBW1_850029 [Desulfamplus magnetovallimortis]
MKDALYFIQKYFTLSKCKAFEKGNTTHKSVKLKMKHAMEKSKYLLTALIFLTKK